VPRTATATCASQATVFALSRTAFLAAVAGHTPTAQAATAVADERLEHDHPYQPATPDDPQPDDASA
jgi:CRP-like cAMP-binding protein